jgi:hypothetical protein
VVDDAARQFMIDPRYEVALETQAAPRQVSEAVLEEDVERRGEDDQVSKFVALGRVGR